MAKYVYACDRCSVAFQAEIADAGSVWRRAGVEARNGVAGRRLDGPDDGPKMRRSAWASSSAT
jgi:hypothetical protein